MSGSFEISREETYFKSDENKVIPEKKENKE